jgi:signal transduction histidine kinase
MRRILLFLLLWLLTPAAWSDTVATSGIAAPARGMSLDGHLALLRDASRQLTVETIAQSADFIALPDDLNLGFTEDAIWLRIPLPAAMPAPGPWLLEVSNALHTDVRLYTRLVNSDWQQQRRVDYRHALFKLDSGTAAADVVYVRIVSRNAIQSNVVLWQSDAFFRFALRESRVFGLLIGFFLVILVVQLFVWYWTRDPVNRWYVSYIAMVFLIWALSNGIFQQTVTVPSLASDSLLVLLRCGYFWVMTNFSTRQIDLGRLMPRTSRVLNRGSALASIILLALALAARYSVVALPTQTIALAIAMLMLLILGLSLWLWLRHGHRPARFYLFAFGPLHVGLLLRDLLALDLIGPSLLANIGNQLGTVWHLLVMSLGVAQRYHTLRRQLLQAQAETLQAKTLLADKLETEVQARTASLVNEIARCQALEAELRRALAVEQQARQEQRDFVAMVSHEFGTPLAIINTSTQHLAKHLDAPREKSLARCGNIRQAVRRMADLIDDYLSLDRLEGDAQPLRLGACDVRLLIDGVCTEWPTGSIALHESALPATLTCDARLLHIALRNLLANGLRHTPPNTPVRLTVRGQASGAVVFEVADGGNGIPADELPKVFQKYFRGRNAQNKPGAGLGLYLVERIVHQHGGEITVQSQPGHGSTFVVRIGEN